jgi:hypothetical protein
MYMRAGFELVSAPETLFSSLITSHAPPPLTGESSLRDTRRDSDRRETGRGRGHGILVELDRCNRYGVLEVTVYD